MQDYVKDIIVDIQPTSILTWNLERYNWKLWKNIFYGLLTMSVMIGIILTVLIIPNYSRKERISFIIIYRTNMDDVSLSTIVDLDSLGLNNHLGLSNVNVNKAQFVPVAITEDKKKREIMQNLNLCENENTDTTGDLFILHLSTEYPLNYTMMAHQQYLLDKMKIDNSSAYKQFSLPIKFINGKTLSIKMSFCSFDQVISPVSIQATGIQKRNSKEFACTGTICSISKFIQSQNWNENIIFNGGLYPNDDKCVAYTYGPDPIQVIDCHLPKGPYAPIVVLLIHGGFWSAKYNRSLEDAVGNDLLRFNIVVCNLDYRSVGNGGNYPNAFYDVSNGTDLIRTIAQEHGFNSTRVIVVGHSAGGQLGGYITGRFRLIPSQPGYSTNPLRPIAFVSQAGVNNMWDGCDQANETGSGAVISFLGGTYQMYPERYLLSSLAASSNISVRAQYPSQFLPLEVPIQAITGSLDITVPVSQTITFAEQAKTAGDNCTRVIVEGEDHFVHLNISSKSWNMTLAFILSFIP
ncbi:unnamed protein product [Rotaria sordida]|uniref:BD-FAE-like domain-containing protein n=1 Tax=Rotaria sordida TaxID=392033 RepID=A0A814EAM5_9BILA|nr:unnamed protein product [Rotaria sordida]CAF1017598.1 unnamed protein product [Rotaria sordida]